MAASSSAALSPAPFAATPHFARPIAARLFQDERLPRYTSYPTAPHFTGQIGSGDYVDWLAALAPGTEASLYLHVPFCRSMCWYCGCNTTVALRDGPVLDYLNVLRTEIGLVADRISAPLDIRHIHFGGGTPTILRPGDFAELVALIRGRFAVHPAAEVAVEIDPRHLDEAMVEALAGSGVNRASLGVQSFDPAVQAAIRRVQSVAQTARVIEALRRSGIGAISFDLIYGLPRQTLASCIATVEECLALAPDRLSIFGYAHVPDFKKHQRRIVESDLPGGAERFAQAEAMAERLVAAGYVRIGLDHFARADDPMALALKAGTLRRNFQGYTTDGCAALIGFGASAIGRVPGGYVQNETVTGRYADRVRAGALPIARGYRLSDDDRLRGAIIERLMCDLTVDLAAVAAQHGSDLAALGPLEAVTALADDGLVAFDGARITLPERSRHLVRKVASLFDAHLEASTRRYSRAV